MHSNKITIVTMLLSSFLLAVPFTPVHATSSTVTVSLDNPNALPGASIIATVSVSPISMLQGWDIQVQFNPDVLTAQSASYTSTLGSPTFSSTPDIFNAGGSVHLFTFRTDGGSVSPSSSAPLMTVNFKVNGGTNPAIAPAQSISELPSTVSIFSAELGLADGSTVFPSTVSASYIPPASWFLSAPIDLASYFCRTSPTTLNTNSHHAFSVTVQCRAVNNSTSVTVGAGVHFTWSSLGGITGSGGSGSVLLAPGQSADLTLSPPLIVPPKSDIYTISAYVGYGFADGTATQSTAVFTYQLQVVVPTNGK